MAEEVEDWGTNSQVRKSGNSLFIPPQAFTKVAELSIISDVSTNSLVTRALWFRYELHTCKQAQMNVVNMPCYLIFLSSSLFNTPRYRSLLNSLHSFDVVSECDDFIARSLHFISYINQHKLLNSRR